MNLSWPYSIYSNTPSNSTPPRSFLPILSFVQTLEQELLGLLPHVECQQYSDAVKELVVRSGFLPLHSSSGVAKVQPDHHPQGICSWITCLHCKLNGFVVASFLCQSSNEKELGLEYRLPRHHFQVCSSCLFSLVWPRHHIAK